MEKLLIYAIDPEANQLKALHTAIQEAEPDAEIRDFRSAVMLRNGTANSENPDDAVPDAVFMATGKGQSGGMAFAEQLKTVYPASHIVLITDTEAYAAKAYALHIQGYIVRPFGTDRIREELDLIPRRNSLQVRKKLKVRCFGFFEVFWGDEPLLFSRKKTKELFALLVFRKGSVCFAEELISTLFEETGPERMKRAKQNLRNLIFDLSDTLRRIGREDLLFRKGSMIAVRPERLDCDYYRMAAGDKEAIDAYRGEFMEQYSWAESVKGTIEYKQEYQEETGATERG